MAKKKKADEDKSDENVQNVNDSDDTFGLPEIEYEPIKREEPKQEEPAAEDTPEEPTAEPAEPQETEAPRFEQEQEPVREQYSYSYREEKQTPSVGPIVAIVIIIFLLLGTGGWYFFSYKPKKDAEEKAQRELAMKQAEEQRERDRIAAELKEQQLAEERRVADSIANAMTPKEGVVETLTERTGRYYVVVASAIDDDLLLDNAQKISKKGTHVRIIPPFRNVKFFRLAVEDGDTFADAQAKADNLKGEYGDGVWVIKY